MNELGVDDFDHFFTELWSTPDQPKKPFQWQRDLAERVLTDEEHPWPEAIALPTAAGKTACIDIAVFVLATQASRLLRGEAITAPRRIFFVVDRRIIVDEAFDRAEAIADKLRKAKDGVLKEIAYALRLIASGEVTDEPSANPLAVHALRGGMYRSEAWARDPLQPTIVASTVDQLGSRLLFRAYGRGPGMWPVYAGLAANDSLVLLDEAHCAQPFLQTLQAVARYREWAEQPLKRRFYPVVMSATPPEGLDRFEDTSSECRDPGHPLGRRQLAHKPAMLHPPVQNATGKNAAKNFAKALVKAAEELDNKKGRAVVVFVNRVATARTVHELLHDRYGDRVMLLTGRMRAVDKQDVVDNRLKLLLSNQAEQRSLDDSLFVVTTQTLEVGADLDFDALVSECASLDALRQRFGRLNRMGRSIDARAAILVRADQISKSNDDPVYGAALAETWKWLNESRNDAGVVDFGIAHLTPRLPDDNQLAALNAPTADAPVMLPAHADCWAQTSPQPAPSPDVSPFLRGPQEGPADVHVCWRIDLNLEVLGLCPPASSETLPVPIAVFKRWLSGNITEDTTSDVEGVADVEVPASCRKGSTEVGTPNRKVLRWRGRDTESHHITADARRIRPGDVVVIPIRANNSRDEAHQTTPRDWKALGELPDAALENPDTLDVGDRAYLTARAKSILRLHPKLIAIWPNGPAKSQAQSLLALPDEDSDELLEVARELLRSLTEDEQSEPIPEWLRTSAGALWKESKRRRNGFLQNLRRIDDNQLVIVGQTLVRKLARKADTFSDEDDATASGISWASGQPVKLFDHLPGVEAFARRFAHGCGLSDELTDAVARAGKLHDLGKADPRFQALLQGGNRWLAGGELLAKSGKMPKTKQAYEAARVASAYPRGGRHELLSVRLAESAPGLLPDTPHLRELILHLIASHHGYCRPFAPVVEDSETSTVSFAWEGHTMGWTGGTGLECLNSGVTERYWRLIKRYGWWGLAWLEALLRLADHRRSEWEESHE